MKFTDASLDEGRSFGSQESVPAHRALRLRQPFVASLDSRRIIPHSSLIVLFQAHAAALLTSFAQTPSQLSITLLKAV